jgi:hypothetical protein
MKWETKMQVDERARTHTHTHLDLQMEDGLGVLDLADYAALLDEDAAMGVRHGSTATTKG